MIGLLIETIFKAQRCILKCYFFPQNCFGSMPRSFCYVGCHCYYFAIFWCWFCVQWMWTVLFLFEIYYNLWISMCLILWIFLGQEQYLLLWDIQFNSVQSLSRVRLFATPWTAAHQASLSITNSRSPPKPMSIESVMPFNHLILRRPLLLLPSIFRSIRIFSNESALHIRWPKYWSFSFNISPSNEHPGLISFRMDWLDLLAVRGTLKSSPTPQFKSINSSELSLLHSPTHIHTWSLEKP